MSARSHGKPLWMIGPVGGSWMETFCGTLAEVVAEINRRHQATGIPHRATEIES